MPVAEPMISVEGHDREETYSISLIQFIRTFEATTEAP